MSNQAMRIKTHSSHQGFTLVELSIVLVIIGLIIGGVLTGQDLIKAAEVRATIGQYEKYNTALNTFRAKFNGHPGDLPNAVGFDFATKKKILGHGDGNFLIEGGAADSTLAVGETVLFWSDLSTANLVDSSFNGTDTATAITAGTVSQTLPSAKLGRGNHFTVFSVAGLNYYQIAGVTATDATGAYTLTNSITPTEAYNIDTKLDDGLATTGIVQAMASTSALNTIAPTGAGATFCVTTDLTPNNYNIKNAANTPLCQVRMRFN
ncbi:MAG: prepilin-type N-terminal cleavage/methylation domain-containing protein [Burkholderiales bacterium]